MNSPACNVLKPTLAKCKLLQPALAQLRSSVAGRSVMNQRSSLKSTLESDKRDALWALAGMVLLRSLR